MKKIFFPALMSVVFFSNCSKHVENTQSSQPIPPPPSSPPIQHVFAKAGADTTICMPYGGTGFDFKGILDGRGSYDDSGKIVSYSWAELGGMYSPEIDSPNNASTAVTFQHGNLQYVYGHQYVLEVRDDHQQVGKDTVTIYLDVKFDYEYDGLSWDSTTGLLSTISVKAKPGLIESWPDFTTWENDSSGVFLNDFNGKCNDISNWKKLPYVPYDSIQLTDKSVFYSLISIPQTVFDQGRLYPEIYVKTNSGIDFKQKVSIGFIAAFPSGAGDWDY